MSSIGILALLERTVPMGRLHMRPFQWYLKTCWKYPQSLDGQISCSEISKRHLSWWEDPNNLLVGCPVHAEEHNLLLFTDASVKGWGAHLGNLTVRGTWLDTETNLHINTRRLCLLSNYPHPKVDTENENISMQNDSSSPRVAGHELVLGPHRSIHKDTTATTSLGKPSQTTIQSKASPKSTISQSSCVASGFETKFPQKFSESVAERINSPQRLSSRKVYESRWTIFESWCKENQVNFNQPFLYSIADFLPICSTRKISMLLQFAGYRTAIADHLGSGVEISRSFELNRPSFHRDRPMKDRSIPSWDFSTFGIDITTF